MNVLEKLEKLRQQMMEKEIDVYIIPSEDFHQSEYVGEYFKARQFMTGFSGSVGTLVVTKTQARLWTDGRYFIQAADQLEGTSVQLMKMGEPGVPTIEEYLVKVLPEGGMLGFDGRVVAVSKGRSYERIVAKKKAKIRYEYDLVDPIWQERPPLSQEPVFRLELKYAGETVASKLERIRNVMKEYQATMHVLTALEDICWTLNIRGNDIKFSPLVLTYAVITMDCVNLYINEAKLSLEIKEELAKDGVVLRPYNDIYEDIKEIGKEEVLLMDPAKLNYALYRNISQDVRKIEERNPEILFKSMKNSVEISNIRKAQIKDSVAHVRFMKWIKEHVGKMKITEIEASKKLDEFRMEMGNFIRPSFAPISAIGEHGAIIHYNASAKTDAELYEGTLFLTDTGAGFYEGSTDVTRTYALGEIPQLMKDHFTLVAISNLTLANAKFLKGCTGATLDMLARKPFWDRNINYNHGTGHGVGYLLSIHEGPAGFRWQCREGEICPLEEGMILTDEPGIYIEGSHGIRLENELLVCKGEQNEYGQFMHFEILTFVPMDLDAMNPDMMTMEEKKMLNNYHRAVYEKVSPYLEKEEKEWLAKYTREI